MALFGRKSRWAGIDMLKLVPRRRIGHKLREERVILLAPRFREPLIGPWIQRLLPEHKKHLQVPLEERGSFLWLHMDGQSSLGDLVKLLAAADSDDDKDLPERVCMYVSNLEQNGFVELTGFATAKIRAAD